MTNWWSSLQTQCDVRIDPLPIADPLATLPMLERELQHTWLVWDAWTAGKRRVDLHPLMLSGAAHREAKRVAENAWALVSAAAERASKNDVERALYRLHPDVDRLAKAARTGNDLGSVARVDLLLRDDGHFVACEVNADCPGGFNETLALPRLSRSAGLRATGAHALMTDPTNVAHRLADSLVAKSGGPGSPRGVIALAYATAYSEDLQICALIERLVLERGGRVKRLAPTALFRNAPSERDARERISVLYRFYPLEYMAGQTNIDAIASATERGELASMTSFAWIYAQSKLAMARAFEHDPEFASEVFPETFAFSNERVPRLLAEREEWVIKRDLSRVGDHVYVGALCSPEEYGEIIADVSAVEEDKDQAWIAQRFVPQRPIETPWGERLLTLGVYLLDGSFAGYFARLSRTSHCSHEALVLPVFVNPIVPSLPAAARRLPKAEVAA